VKVFNASPTEYEDFKRAYLNDGDNLFSKYPPKLAGLMVDAIFNPYLITADKSVVHMEVNVQFRINDPEKWLTSVSHDYHETYDPAAKDDLRNQLMQQLVERALIAQTSRLTFEQLLLGSRESLPRTMQTFVENALKIETTEPNNPTKKQEVDLGIEILRVEVTQVRPPEAVMQAYQDVLTQRVGREAKKAEAEATKTSTVTAAKGDAQRDIVKAQEYATKTVQSARGEADRFSEVLKQYNNAPDLTKTNLFTEAAATVTGNAKRIYFPQTGEGVTLMVDPPEYDPNQVKKTGQ
jgi:membrane protease subunit HflK